MTSVHDIIVHHPPPPSPPPFFSFRLPVLYMSVEEIIHTDQNVRAMAYDVIVGDVDTDEAPLPGWSQRYEFFEGSQCSKTVRSYIHPIAMRIFVEEADVDQLDRSLDPQ